MMFIFGVTVGFSIVSVLVFVLAAANRKDKVQAKKHFELLEQSVDSSRVTASYAAYGRKQYEALERIVAALESKKQPANGLITIEIEKIATTIGVMAHNQIFDKKSMLFIRDKLAELVAKNHHDTVYVKTAAANGM